MIVRHHWRYRIWRWWHRTVLRQPDLGAGHPLHADFCGGWSGDVHAQFGLSYASYLVWPRSLMQEMPADWQHRFAQLAEEIDSTFRAPLSGRYEVITRDGRGRFMGDPLHNYRHGLTKRDLERARDVYGMQDGLNL